MKTRWLLLALSLASICIQPIQAAPDPVDKAVRGLIKALSDKDSNVVYYAAEALGKIGPAAAPAIPALIEVLKDEKGANSSTAGNGLVSIGNRSIPALCRMAKDKKCETRSRAVLYLRYFSTSQVITTLIAVLSDKESRQRAEAAASLAYLGPKAKQAVSELIDALNDPFPNVRQNAAFALGAILKPAAKR